MIIYTVAKEKLNKIIFEKNGETIFGATQEWYPTKWQRISGCGPTTAAVLFACFDDGTAPMRSVDDWLNLMQLWWAYVTPGFMGVNSTYKFAFGADQFFIKHRLPYKTRLLAFPTGNYPPLSKTLNFLKDGLCSNCPVAFINLEDSCAEGVSAWHWVTITSLTTDGEKAKVTIFDEGKSFEVNFSQWYETACHSGGLVYFSKE